MGQSQACQQGDGGRVGVDWGKGGGGLGEGWGWMGFIAVLAVMIHILSYFYRNNLNRALYILTAYLYCR